MQNYVKKIVHNDVRQNVLLPIRVLLLTIVICVATSSFVRCSTLSFNTLFPATWYEKGLNSTISVWHKVCNVLDNKNEIHVIEELDIILGRFAFAYFCLEKMHQNKQSVMDEDIIYFANLLHRIEDRLSTEGVDAVYQDRIDCLIRVVAMMKSRLQVPSNV